MTAEFRALIDTKIRRAVYGDGKEETDLVKKVAEGQVRDWGEYQSLSGFIRGMTEAMNLVQDAWEELYEPKPPEPQQPKPEGRDT